MIVTVTVSVYQPFFPFGSAGDSVIVGGVSLSVRFVTLTYAYLHLPEFEIALIVYQPFPISLTSNLSSGFGFSLLATT